MIRHLYIRNFTIIEELDIDLFPGFSVITGETGAGKSIVLGAIGLLKGQRADSKMIRSGADRCIVEAHFDLSKYDMQAFFTDNDIEYDATALPPVPRCRDFNRFVLRQWCFGRLQVARAPRSAYVGITFCCSFALVLTLRVFIR